MRVIMDVLNRRVLILKTVLVDCFVGLRRHASCSFSIRLQRGEPPASRLRAKMHQQMFEDLVQEAVHVLLPEMLRKVPVRAPGHVREQASLPVLQQLEDPDGRPQMPVRQLSSDCLTYGKINVLFALYCMLLSQVTTKY